MVEFVGWEKTPRWNRDIVITEKIDGTNAAVVIEEFHFGEHADDPDTELVFGANDETGTPNHEYVVTAQSRKRIITPESDNYGFARWVRDNSDSLVRDLGPGRHYGEWWGQGIQRKYRMQVKVFSLFNTHKWMGADFETENLSTVPLLYQGPNDPEEIDEALRWLRLYGSAATQDFDDSDFGNPEGICIFHTAANRVFKITLENDESPKSVTSGNVEVLAV